MTRFLHKILMNAAVAAALCVSASSCSMMEDDNSDCPTGLYVRFAYDYNTQRADMFRDHVGHVTLYVFDETGRKVAERSVSNGSALKPLREYGYAIHFNEGELPPGKYRLQAVAMQKDWDEALKAPGAKYRRTESVLGHTDLVVSLDHSADPIAGTNYHEVRNNGAPMDTLWHTLRVTSTRPDFGRKVPDVHPTLPPYSVYPLEEQFVVVEKEKATYATVSLIRDTKHLDITLRQIDDPDNMFDDHYSVEILEPNAYLAHDNAVMKSDSLRYTPYAQWTTRLGNNGGIEIEDGNMGSAVQRTAHYNIMFNRLVIDPDNIKKGAILRIRHVGTGRVVALMNLTHLLAQGRTAYELQNYPHQEYLDREYDYHLDFLLKGDAWAYCYIRLNVLSWSKRIENIEL